MTMYATLEEPLTLHAKNFLQTTPASTPKTECATVQCPKIRFAGRRHHVEVEFFADEGEEGECLPMISGKLRKVSLTATMMR